MYKTEVTSPLGTLTLTSDGKYLTGLFIENQKYFLYKFPKNLKEEDNLPLFKETKLWLNDYFNGKNPSTNNLKLNPQGTKFRKIVWQELLKIPYGKTITYKELGKKLQES